MGEIGGKTAEVGVKPTSGSDYVTNGNISDFDRPGSKRKMTGPPTLPGPKLIKWGGV